MSRAGGVRTPDRRLVVAVDGFSAGRANFRHFKHFLSAVALIRDRRDDLGDYISGFLQYYRVAEHYVALSYKVEVVERGSRDRCSCKSHGFEHRRRRKHSGSADCDSYVNEFSFFLFGWEFVRDRPLRRVRSLAEFFAILEKVRFDDDAVDVVGKVVAHRAEFLDPFRDFFGRFQFLTLFYDRKTEVFKPIQRFGVRTAYASVTVRVARLEIKDENGKSARRRDFGVELTERSCRRVTRICEKLFAVRLFRGVETFKDRSWHINFAANGHVDRLAQFHRDIEYGFEVLSDVLADNSVAARCAFYENAFFVGQRHRKTVYFRLDRVFSVSERFGGFFDKFAEFFERKHVGQRVHDRVVRHFLELFKRFAADALCRRVGRVILRVLRLEFQEFRVHHIVLVVRNYGRVVNVIELRVVRQFFSQFFNSFLCVSHTVTPYFSILIISQ